METGKPISQTKNEIKATEKRIEFFLENIDAVIADKNSDKEIIKYEALGVIANISAWNYPYFVGTNVFIPALLCGNSVLYKASEFSIQTGLAIENCFKNAGLPDNLFLNVIGTGEQGRFLLEQNINGMFFTGSYPTGIKISHSVSDKLIKTQFELGGKDPIYVCNDTNVEGAAEALADGAFYNCGQSCCAVERIYIHKDIYHPFVEHFSKIVRSFKVGDPMDELTYIGPLTRSAQLEVLEDQVKDAQLKGAKLVCGGKRLSREGFYFEPTVLIDCNHGMKVMREESFGPIIGLMPVENDAEALKLMNDTEYGLTAGVYTQDKQRAEKIMGELNSGSVYWNCCDRVNPKLPWTGRKHSGLGSTLSTIGIECFLQPKAWHF